MWNDVCYLGSADLNGNSIGDTFEEVNFDKEVYCNELSIKYSEFYQAQAVGMKPEITLEVMLLDYNKERYVKYDGENYTVLRTFKKTSEKIELILTKGINNANSA